MLLLDNSKFEIKVESCPFVEWNRVWATNPKARSKAKMHQPIFIERVDSFKFLVMHFSEDLPLAQLIDEITKKILRQHYLPRRLTTFGMLISMVLNVNRWTVESILTGCITT